MQLGWQLLSASGLLDPLVPLGMAYHIIARINERRSSRLWTNPPLPVNDRRRSPGAGTMSPLPAYRVYFPSAARATDSPTEWGPLCC